MSRREAKKRRLAEPDLPDIFTSSSSAHIFAPSSTNRSSSLPDELYPTSYEITLNHDTELKRSFQLAPDGSINNHGSRLVTWTSSCGKQSVTTDRYDAVHLLSQLPPKPSHTGSTADPVGDLGWSDLDSDTEDMFYMTDAEADQFKHDKARSALEAQHSTRLANLSSLSPSPPLHPEAAIEDDKEPNLSRTQFELMQKTAKIVTSSSNASMLELKILTNHASDERFSFLYKARNPQLNAIWEELKNTHGEMSYESASRMLQETHTNSNTSAPLVAYDSSDSETESNNPQTSPVKHPNDSSTTITTADDTLAAKKQKQAQRLARAKTWLQTRHSKPPFPPP
ncbi:SURP motif domain-containing protein [Pseudozyma hubeiensis]|nr:SURP motif domain-containing protein [Pseudozyma hubeiensis]